METLTRKIQGADVLHGETLSGEPVAVLQPKKGKRKKRTKAWRDRVGQVDFQMMMRLEMNGSQWRVLWAIMAAVPPRGGCDAFITLNDVARQTGIHRTDVGKVVSGLRDRKILWNIRQGQWRVNSWLMYNGDYDSWDMESQNDPEPTWMRGVNSKTGEVK